MPVVIGHDLPADVVVQGGYAGGRANYDRWLEEMRQRKDDRSQAAYLQAKNLVFQALNAKSAREHDEKMLQLQSVINETSAQKQEQRQIDREQRVAATEETAQEKVFTRKQAASASEDERAAMEKRSEEQARTEREAAKQQLDNEYNIKMEMLRGDAKLGNFERQRQLVMQDDTLDGNQIEVALKTLNAQEQQYIVTKRVPPPKTITDVLKESTQENPDGSGWIMQPNGNIDHFPPRNVKEDTTVKDQAKIDEKRMQDAMDAALNSLKKRQDENGNPIEYTAGDVATEAKKILDAQAILRGEMSMPVTPPGTAGWEKTYNWDFTNMSPTLKATLIAKGVNIPAYPENPNYKPSGGQAQAAPQTAAPPQAILSQSQPQTQVQPQSAPKPSPFAPKSQFADVVNERLSTLKIRYSNAKFDLARATQQGDTAAVEQANKEIAAIFREYMADRSQHPEQYQ